VTPFADTATAARVCRAAVDSEGRRSGSFLHVHFNVQPSGGHVNQRVEAKQVDLAAHQVGDTRLRHAEQPGGQVEDRLAGLLCLFLQAVRT